MSDKKRAIQVTGKELSIVKSILKDLLHGERVLVFGSRARGTHKTTSDLDLAIVSDTPMTISTRSRLEFAFSEADLPFRVDIVDLLSVEAGFQRVIQDDSVELDYR